MSASPGAGSGVGMSSASLSEPASSHNPRIREDARANASIDDNKRTISRMRLRVTSLLALAAAAALLSVSALVYWGVVVEPGRLVVRRAEVDPPDWPEAWNGLRIVALSDIHAGSPHVDGAKLD